MTNTLKLTFIYAYPLDQGRRSLFVGRGDAYPSMEEIKIVLERWRKVWDEADSTKKIITYVTELTGRVPERNLECFVFGAGLQAMSTPFLLPIWNKEGKSWTDEKFIDLVIHELLHIFLTTNNKQYWNYVSEKYIDEDPVCRNHILLYAMLYQVYETLFNTEPIDFGRDNLPPGYARAVELVKKFGYKEIIAEYKAFI